MKRIISIMSTLIFGMGLLYSQETPLPGSDLAYQTQTLNGSVTKVAPARHKISVKLADDREITIRIPDAVDLTQYHKGDKVSADYVEAVAVQLRKATPLETKSPLQVVDSAQVTRAGIEQIQQVMALVQVTRVDHNRGYLEFKDLNDDKVSVKVGDPNQLSQFKDGDRMVISYTEATATALRKIK